MLFAVIGDQKSQAEKVRAMESSMSLRSAAGSGSAGRLGLELWTMGEQDQLSKA
jgi:hypothetical protein